MMYRRPCGRAGKARWSLLEQMEPRTLLSLTIGGITIPGIPSIPSIPSLANFPAVTNELNLSGLSSFINPNPSDYWWLNNTGQTLTDAVSGPATGTPGADINALKAWNITTGKSNVVVAVLDTGIDLNNAALDSVLWTNPGNLAGDTMVNDIHGWNFVDNNNNMSDNFVHGTAVAASIHSVAPGVTILPVEIGTASGASAQDVIDGINYLIMLKKAGVNIVAINASYISYDAPTMDEINAIKSAGSAGMLYVAAAGNAGMNLDSLIPNVPSSLAKYIPSLLPSNLIFVAATDDQDNLASFSDYGANTVALGAPGVDMTLPIPGGLYAPLSGTSFAAPMVSGIAALLASEVPSASITQMKNAILNSGDLDPALTGKTITGRRADAYNALTYLMGNQPPSGAVEVLNNTAISGWAFDPNLGAAAASVLITMDGSTLTTIQAGDPSSDVAAQLGSPDHGFSFDTSGLAYGKHAIKVYVLDNITGKQTLIGQGTIIVDTPPDGAIETAGTKVVTGWAEDGDTPAKNTQVKLFLDGKSWLTTTASLADVSGPDGVHGFQFKLPSMKAGIHRVDVYAVDTLTGALVLIGSSTVSSNQPPTGQVEVLNAALLSGWAFDPDAGSKAIQVEYQIDGFAPVFVTANISRPDLQTALGSKNHGFSITLPQLSAGEHTITVYAVDANNKMLTELTSQTVTVTAPEGDPLPTGGITTFTGSQIAGTVTDAGSAAPVLVRVDIDGKAGKPFLSTATAEDGTYAFTYVPNPKLKGAHRVDVWAMDDQTHTPVLIARELLNYVAPTATVTSFTAQTVAGFALAPGAANSQAYVRLDVDGLSGNLVTANLGAMKNSFSITMPQVAPGDHVATLYLVDPTTLLATVIGTLDYTTV